MSLATAESVCEPSTTPVLFQVVVYGEDVMAEPTLVASTLNWTLETETSSAALAESVTEEPETVAPMAGAVTDTVGAVVSWTVTVKEAFVVLPALSDAVQVTVAVPSAKTVPEAGEQETEMVPSTLSVAVGFT